MTDAQNWTLVVGFLGLLGVMVTMTLRVVRAELRAVYGEFGTVRAEFGTVRAEIDTVRAELRGVEERLNVRIDHLDRDIQTVVNRLMDG